MKTVYVECRNCNTYLKVDKKDCKYRCNKCGLKEDLVVIKDKGSNQDEKK